MTTICAVLGLARRTAYYHARARPGGRYQRSTDATVLQQIHAVTKSRATYGYRRVWAMVNRRFRPEAFVKTFKRDYVDGAELRDAETVLAQLGTWFEDYNTRAPHSALDAESG